MNCVERFGILGGTIGLAVFAVGSQVVAGSSCKGDKRL